MRKLATLAALVLLALAGCSSSSDVNDPSNNDPSGNNENRYPYQPASKGSTWTYSGSQNYTITITGDTTINGKSYILGSSSIATDGLISVENGEYRTYQTTSPVGGILYLKENAPVGSSWETAYGNNRYVCTVSAVGATRTVYDHTFTDVIQVHQTAYVGSFKFNEGDYYYAKGVGLIETNLSSLAAIKLASYEIK